MLSNLSKVLTLAPGESLTSRSTHYVQVPHLFFLKRGELHVSGDRGKMTRWLRPGDWIGERTLLYGETLNLDVVAEQRSEVLCMDICGIRDALVRRLDPIQLQQHSIRISLLRVGLLLDRSTAEQLATVRLMQFKKYAVGARIDEKARVCVILDGVVTALGDAGMEVLLCGETFRTAGRPGPAHERRAVSAVTRFVSGPSGCCVAILDDAVIQHLPETSADVPTCLPGSVCDSRERDLARIAITLRKVNIFRDLSLKRMTALAVGCRRQLFVRGAKVLEQGEWSSHFFVVVFGEVHALVGGKAVRKLARFSYFGERSILFEKPRTATIKVVSPEAEIWSIDKETLKLVLSEKPEMYDHMIHRIQLQDSSTGLSELSMLGVVGFGNSGVVQVVKHQASGLKYALKRVRKVDGKVPHEAKHEIEVLTEFDHPFVVYLVKTFETPKSIYMLTEYISGGELYAAIRTIPTVLSRKQAMFYAGSIMLMLEVLYDRNIVYRDLKPENLMLDHTGYVKLIDFGIAKKLTKERPKTFTMVGTPHYMAPEIMRGKGYSTEVDVWSLGVILYELVVGNLPFGVNELEDVNEVCKAVLHEELSFPDNFSPSLESARSLVCRLLDLEPETRIGCGVNNYDDIKSAPFFELPRHRTSAGNYFDLLISHEIQAPIVPSSESTEIPESGFRGTASFGSICSQSSVSSTESLSNSPEELERIQVMLARMPEISRPGATTAQRDEEVMLSDVVSQEGSETAVVNAPSADPAEYVINDSTRTEDVGAGISSVPKETHVVHPFSGVHESDLFASVSEGEPEAEGEPDEDLAEERHERDCAGALDDGAELPQRCYEHGEALVLQGSCEETEADVLQGCYEQTEADLRMEETLSDVKSVELAGDSIEQSDTACYLYLDGHDQDVVDNALETYEPDAGDTLAGDSEGNAQVDIFFPETRDALVETLPESEKDTVLQDGLSKDDKVPVDNPVPWAVDSFDTLHTLQSSCATGSTGNAPVPEDEALEPGTGETTQVSELQDPKNELL